MVAGCDATGSRRQANLYPALHQGLACAGTGIRRAEERIGIQSLKPICEYHHQECVLASWTRCGIQNSLISWTTSGMS